MNWHSGSRLRTLLPNPRQVLLPPEGLGLVHKTPKASQKVRTKDHSHGLNHSEEIYFVTSRSKTKPNMAWKRGLDVQCVILVNQIWPVMNTSHRLVSTIRMYRQKQILSGWGGQEPGNVVNIYCKLQISPKPVRREPLFLTPGCYRYIWLPFGPRRALATVHCELALFLRDSSLLQHWSILTI